MEVFRFMSRKEFYKLINGEKLINKTKHEGHTNSVGFCFMGGIPEECYEFLSGIVSDEVCVIFETNKELKETYRIYADPFGSFFETITRDEYCTTTYNKENFTIKKIAIPNYKNKWKWYKDINSFCDKLKLIEQEEIKEKKKNQIKEKAKKIVEQDNFKALQELFSKLYEIKEIALKKDNREYVFKNMYISNVEVEGDMFRKTLKFRVNIII